MKLLIISASQRIASQSAKVAQYIARQDQGFTSVSHFELCRFNLPFWDGDSETKSLNGSGFETLNQQVKHADALVLITPEWGGMASPLLKNFLLMIDGQNTAHKPALLVAVSSGISGAYPIAELKMNALKNNKIVPIPDHLIIRNVQQVLDSDLPVNPRDEDLRSRIDYSLYMLHQYSGALLSIRDAHNNRAYPKQQEYAYGM